MKKNAQTDIRKLVKKSYTKASSTYEKHCCHYYLNSVFLKGKINDENVHELFDEISRNEEKCNKNGTKFRLDLG